MNRKYFQGYQKETKHNDHEFDRKTWQSKWGVKYKFGGKI